jgi:hypothetical protein
MNVFIQVVEIPVCIYLETVGINFEEINIKVTVKQ